MNRYLILFSAALMQMCLGATYSWSVYVERLRALTGLGQGAIQLPFTLFYFAFPATMIGGGMLVARWGPRRCAMLGGALFGGGWLLAALGARHFAFTVAGIGLMAGVGVGLAYIVPIAVGVRWFPEHKGLVTGVAVAGFGGGAALLSQVGGALLERGLSPFTVFGVLGLAFLVIVPLAGALMQNPPDDPSESPGSSDALIQTDSPGPSDAKNSPLSFRAILSCRNFRLLYIAMIAGLAAGFAVNANLKDMAPADAAARLGVLAVSLFAIANASGRILWGWFFDHMPRAAMALRLNLWSQAAVMLAAPFILRVPAGYLILALLVGFNYGGVLVLYAATTARLWGAVRLSQVYGLLFSANIPAALAPLLAGFVFDLSGAFTFALLALAIFLMLAGVLISRGQT